MSRRDRVPFARAICLRGQGCCAHGPPRHADTLQNGSTMRTVRGAGSTLSQAILASCQEWGSLQREPTNRWSHPLAHRWSDPAGSPLVLGQNSPNLSASLGVRLTQAFLGPPNCTACVDWRGDDVEVRSRYIIYAGGWHFSSSDGQSWSALRPEPCPGQLRTVA